MKNTTQKGNVAVILLIIIVLVAGGWYLYNQNSVKVNSGNTETLVQQTPSGWVTYTDVKYKFKLAYPNNYKINEANSDGACVAVVAWMEGYFENDVLRQNSLKNNAIIDFNAIINDPEDKCVAAHYSSPAGSGIKKLIESKEIIVNGNKVLQRNYIDDLAATGVEGKAFEFSTFRFQKGDTFVTLLINNGITSDPGTVDNVEALNLFVNSFEFIN